MAAFVKTAIPNRYIGASTDTKPTVCGVGSICYETDTGAEYITADGGSTWVQYAATAYLNDINAASLTLSDGAGALTFSAAATIVAALGLTMPAFTLGGAVTGNAQTISNANVTVGAGRTLDVSAGTLTLADDQIGGDKVEGGTINAVTINTLTLGTGLTGADKPLTDVGDVTFHAGSVLASGSTNGDTLLLKANDTTFITLITGATDAITIANATMSGTWLASGTVTMPALTLGGAITGAAHYTMGDTFCFYSGLFKGRNSTYARWGDAGTTGHSLDSEDDLLVTGDLEVDGTLYADGDLVAGTFAIDADSGAVTLVDMSVTDAPADNTEESLAFKIDGNTLLKLYSQADSAGAVDTMSVQYFYPLQGGSSASPMTLTVGTPLFAQYTTCADEGTGNAIPFYVKSTMTGAGGYGARSQFDMTANVALGSYANALKAYTSFGATGRVTGMASALCAELALSAGTTEGSYAALEAELVAATGDPVGTSTSFLYCNAGGTGSTTVIDAQACLFQFGAQLSAGANGFIDTDITTHSAYGGIRIKMPDGSVKYLAVVSD
jgi:hypothetical protein